MVYPLKLYILIPPFRQAITPLIKDGAKFNKLLYNAKYNCFTSNIMFVELAYIVMTVLIDLGFQQLLLPASLVLIPIPLGPSWYRAPN